MWIDDAVYSLNKVVPMKLEDKTSGWCCLKHELEFGPEELELVSISFKLAPHHQPENILRAVYDVFVKYARQSGQHKIVHFDVNPTNSVIALQKIPKEDTTGRLNVEL